MIFEKIRRARIEARRLYEPGTVPLIVVLALFTVYALVTGVWFWSIFGGVGTGWVLWQIFQNDHRWRATDEPE